MASGEGKRGEGKRGEGKRGEGKRGEGKRGEGKRGGGKRGEGRRDDGERSEGRRGERPHAKRVERAARRRIALFGGSFNPPHRTHHRIAQAALEQLPIEQLWVLPCGNHPLKDNSDLADAGDRLAMCRLAFAELDDVVVSEMDLQGDRPAYTIELLERVRDQHSDVGRPYWLLGADNLPQLPLWKDYRRLFDLADLVVYPRRGYALDESAVDSLDLPHHHRRRLLDSALEFEPDEVSSTRIRQALSADGSSREVLTQWLAPAVLAAITERGLYREDR